ncbi:Heme transport protein HutA (fragment) [Vibrio tapetis subsp. tapetis]|uniref:Heme transport protein HutA n=1 Tax=Vibrio tapetis subsp. tapetis TaxID=1671868 RepID=A0A2N8ZNG9_9VIBR
MIKSVEVVKGAASSLQGSDAIGGIVAFETKDPSDFLKGGKDIGGHAKLNYSSADKTFSQSVALANRFEDLETLVAYTHKNAEELNNFGNDREQETKADNLLVKLQYQLNQEHRIEFTGEMVKGKTDTVFNDSDYKNYTGKDTSDRTRVGIKHIWNTKAAYADKVEWQLDYMSKKTNGVTNRTYLKASRGTPAGNVQTKDYIYNDKGFQGDIQLDKFFTFGNSEHFVVYGASFSDKDIENVNDEFNSLKPDTQVFYMPEASERRYGLFVQDEITIGKLILTPGIRTTHLKPNQGIIFQKAVRSINPCIKTTKTQLLLVDLVRFIA